MPQKKGESLHRLCLKHIADNAWMIAENQGRSKHNISPFSYLTGEDIQELIDILIERRSLNESRLHTLLIPRLKVLKLSRCPAAMVKDSTLRLLPVRCQGLTSLNLPSFTSVSAAALTEMVKGLPHLWKLDLSYTKASDQTVAAIAESCHHLHVLSLSDCRVTSSGVLALCGNSSSGSQGCQSLVTLNIFGTEVSVNGAMALIQGLPQLQYFQHDNCIEAVGRLYAEVYAERQPMHKEKKLRLKGLYGCAFKEKAPVFFQLLFAAVYCPAVTEVELMYTTSNEMLGAISGLKHLQKLHVTSRRGAEAPFKEGLSPLLKHLGQGLLSLGAFQMADLNLAAVGLFCPNLERLECVLPRVRQSGLEVESLPMNESQWNSIFCHLQHLNLTISEHTTSSFEKAFSHLLRNASGLEELHLYNVQFLDDDMLSDAICLHGFQSLQKLVLQKCHSMTGSAIGQLVRADNALSQVVVDTCEGFSAAEFKSLKTFGLINNLDLSMVMRYH